MSKSPGIDMTEAFKIFGEIFGEDDIAGVMKGMFANHDAGRSKATYRT